MESSSPNSARGIGSDPRPLVVWLAGVSWEGIAGTDRQLVQRLLDHVDVLWVDPARSVIRSRGTGQGLRPALVEERPGLLRLRPVGPPLPFRRGVAPFTTALVRQTLRRTVARLERHPDLVVSTSPHPDLTALPGVRTLYYATDDFVAGAGLMGKAPDRFGRLESRRLDQADVVGAVSPQILRRWGRTGFVLPNGCDLAHYADLDGHTPDGLDAEPETVLGLPRPVVGMIGQLSPRIDLTLLEAIPAAGLSLLLVGPRQHSWEPDRLDRLLAHPRVHWTGQQPWEELPAWLRMVDVGVTPYVEDDFNRASFPLKTLEYLAAGRAAVSTPLPAVEGLATPHIRTGRSPEEFVAAIRSALTEGVTPGWVAARRAAAAEHDWSERAAEFLRVSGLAEACRSGLTPGGR
ncbi:glycosyltransferase [Nocardioides insulae]|uniref:glycosyltransferase n=1 Tax=Nocardioides insulae TaxID=394734 RepID=UPI000404E22E|nr:glycosyltransferase [Nocardioides insulae]